MEENNQNPEEVLKDVEITPEMENELSNNKEEGE